MCSGCATSKITAFKDPEFAGSNFESIAVFAHGMRLDAAVAVESEVCEKFQSTQCKKGTSILPPTRAYSDDEFTERLHNSGVKAILLVSLAADQSDTQFLGTWNNSSTTATTNSTGTANLFGNNVNYSGNSYGQANTQSVSIPMYGVTRVAFVNVALFERNSGKAAWSGQVRVEGNGAYNVTDDAFISSASKSIAKELKATGLVK